MATPHAFKDYIVKFHRGDRIYSTGDAGTEMYIVQTGSVTIFSEVDGRRIVLATMEKGDFFGEMALIESVPHSSCAEAQTDCELIEINSTLFDKMIKGNIEIAVRMLRKLSIRMRDATRRLGEMAAAGGGPAAVPAAARTAAIMSAPAAPRVPGKAAPAPAPSSSAPQPAALATGQRPRNCHAVFLSEDGKELFQLVSPRVAIGRFDPVTGLKPEVDLSELDLNRSVSRHHARLMLEGGVYSVTEEVGALNGTFINGKKLVSGKASPIKDGDLLNLGMVKLICREIHA